jgi:hypothetical protein
MKRFTLFVTILLTVFISTAFYLEVVFRDCNTLGDYIFRRYLKHANELECLFVGNSHIGALDFELPKNDPRIVNMSVGGQDIFRSYTVIQAVLKQSPNLKKIYIGLDYDLIGYNQSKSGQEYIDRMYYKYTGILYNDSYSNRLMASSSFFRSNRAIGFIFNRHQDEDLASNFIPVANKNLTDADCRRRADEQTRIKYKTYNIEENIGFLNKIFKLCKEHHVQLVALNPPKSSCYKHHANAEVMSSASHIMDSILTANGVAYNNFYIDSSFHDNLFVDFDHVNQEGVKLLLKKLNTGYY